MSAFLIVQSAVLLTISAVNVGFISAAIWYTEWRDAPAPLTRRPTDGHASTRPTLARKATVQSDATALHLHPPHPPPPPAAGAAPSPVGGVLMITVAPAPVSPPNSPPALLAVSGERKSGDRNPFAASRQASLPPPVLLSVRNSKQSALAATGDAPQTPHAHAHAHAHPHRPPAPTRGSYLYVYRRFGLLLSLVQLIQNVDPLGSIGIYPYILVQLFQPFVQALIAGAVFIWSGQTLLTIHKQTGVDGGRMPVWVKRLLWTVPIVYLCCSVTFVSTYWAAFYSKYGTDYARTDRDMGGFRYCLIATYLCNMTLLFGISFVILIPYWRLNSILREFKRTAKSMLDTSYIDHALANLFIPSLGAMCVCIVLLAYQFYAVALRLRDPTLVDRENRPSQSASLSSLIQLVAVLCPLILCWLTSPFDFCRRCTAPPPQPPKPDARKIVPVTPRAARPITPLTPIVVPAAAPAAALAPPAHSLASGVPDSTPINLNAPSVLPLSRPPPPPSLEAFASATAIVPSA